MKSFKVVLVLCCYLFISTQSRAQSLSIFNVDAANFPIMTAKFFAFDSGGKQLRPSASELLLNENGMKKAILSVICPPANYLKALSSVLVIDVSGSMSSGRGTPHIELAKTAAQAWVNALPLGESECAITSFDNANYLNQDFTTDRARLLTSIVPLIPQGGTSYDAALLDLQAGGLVISKKGKNQKVIVFLTDGLPNRIPNVSAIVLEANAQKCIIFCVTLGMPAPQSVKDIASQTGGKTYENITTLEEVEQVYRTILQESLDGNPCEVRWMSDINCNPGVRNVELNWNQSSGKSDYSPPQNAIAELRISPAFVAFGPRLPLKQYDTSIRLTAMNAAFQVKDIRVKSGSSIFSVTGTTFPFTVAANASVAVNLRISPTDSNTCYALFEVLTDSCPAHFSVNGGYKGKKMRNQTLKLIHPNGGEVFVVGSDTVITWDGIGVDDRVQLEYSSNNGISWSIISDATSGLRYEWKNIPLPASTKYLVRVRQILDDRNRIVPIVILIGHSNSVLGVAFSPDGNQVATSGNDKTLMLWDAHTGSNLRTFTGHTSDVKAVAFSPLGTQLLSSSGDNMAKIWSVNSGTLIRTLIGHTKWVHGCAFSPKGDRVVTASGDSTAIVWNTNTGSIIQVLRGHGEAVVDAAFSPDGNQVVTSSYDNTAKIWDANSGALLRTITGQTDDVLEVAYSSDGSKIVGACRDYTAKIWDANTGASLRTLSGHTSSVRSAVFSPDANRVLTGSDDMTAKIWDANTGAVVRTLKWHWNDVNDVAYSQDGGRILLGSRDNTATIWDVDDVFLQEDVSDAVFSVVMPVPSSRDVDMGQTVVGSARDSVISGFVENKGSYPLRIDSIIIVGADASQFALVSGLPPFLVPSGGSHDVEFRFIPSTATVKAAQLLVYTQASMLTQTIRGKGMAPVLKISGKLIDFGSVEVGKFIDTLHAATIRNIGAVPVTIISTRHTGPNSIDFTTLSGGGAFTLKPGDSARMDLRFAPSRKGRTSGRLSIEYSGIGSPAIIQLFGEGLQRAPQIVSASINFQPLTCEIEKIDSLKIINIGGEDLHLSSAIISGPNPGDFSFVIPFSQVIIQADSAIVLPIRFIPQASGDRGATLEVHSNSLKDSVLKLSLNGRKESADFGISADMIDLGVFCPGEQKDTLLTLFNAGTIVNTFTLQTSNLILGKSSVTVNAGDNSNVEIHFSGLNTDGDIDDVINVWDSVCNMKKVIRVVGRVETPKLSATDLTLSGLVHGVPVEDALTLSNESGRAVLIQSPPVIIPFEFVNATFPLSIPANSNVSLKVRYIALDTTTQSINAVFDAQPCGVSVTVLITGRGVSGITNIASATLSVSRASAFPGSEVSIPILLSKATNIATSGIDKFTSRLRLNATMLEPIGITPQGNLQGTERTIEIDLPTSADSLGVLTSLLFRAGLGNDTVTTIIIDTVYAVGGAVNFTTVNGEFRLLGICYEGGSRLLNPNGAVTLMLLRPNPVVSGMADVEFETTERGSTRLVLFDVNGSIIREFFNEEIPSGRRRMHLEIKDVPNGAYFLKLQTSTEVRVQRLEVVR